MINLRSSGDTVLLLGKSNYAENGVYVSTNGCESWTQMNQGLSNTRVATIAISPDHRLYAGINEGEGGPAFRTTMPVCCQ
jgi:hypothetical protein